VISAGVKSPESLRPALTGSVNQASNGAGAWSVALPGAESRRFEEPEDVAPDKADIPAIKHFSPARRAGLRVVAQTHYAGFGAQRQRETGTLKIWQGLPANSRQPSAVSRNANSTENVNAQPHR
jgi:hypothetical protein